MKKFIIIILCLVLCLTVLLTACKKDDSPESIVDLSYELNSDGIGYKIVGYKQSLVGKVILPNIINGLPVTEIATGAFKDCDEITELVIPNTIINIEEGALSGCSSLKSLTGPVPNNFYYETVDYRHFGSIFGSENYKDSVEISDRAYYQALINDGLLSYDKLEMAHTYYLPLSLEKIIITSEDIMSGAFCSINTIPEIIITDSVIEIGAYAFANCNSINRIVIPAYGFDFDYSFDNIFMDCKDINVYCNYPESYSNIAYSEDLSFPVIFADENKMGVTEDGYNYFINHLDEAVLFDGYFGKATKAIVPEKINGYPVVTMMNVFVDSSDVTEVVIPNGVKHLLSTFMFCESLKSVNLPDSLVSINGCAFCGPSIKSIEIPSGVSIIGYRDFQMCKSLEVVKLPDSIIKIDREAFEGCSAMKSITLPKSVAFISKAAFANCNKLTVNVRAESQPNSWHKDWNISNRDVVWGYKG